MSVVRFRQGHSRRNRAPRRYYLATRGRWNEPDAFGLATAAVITCMGLVLLVGFAAAEFTNAPLAGVLFVFLSAPFLVLGGLLLLLVFVEFILRRLRRIQNHCGRCRFYQPLEGQYTLGRCGADPREAKVHRTNGCPFFSYSERAMARERLAQRAEVAVRSPKYVSSKCSD
jgi:hypothetical protein